MTRDPAIQPFGYNDPAEALVALLSRLLPVGTETLPADQAVGRVLAEPIAADRPSPACDVSAMDGYCVRLADLSNESLPVAGEVQTGCAPSAMPTGAALRIFTGGAVPEAAQAVIPREHVNESADAIGLPSDLSVAPGQHIRRAGENARRGDVVIEPGCVIDATRAATLATVGATSVSVYRRVKLKALVTGDEVAKPQAAVEPWQVRDSNGPALAAMFGNVPWVEWRGVEHVIDDATLLKQRIAETLAESDALLMTGGVSMGDHDHVPHTLAGAGVELLFHKLPQRPGKPLLGAVGPAGQAVLALPGNPVSVMATARRFAVAALRKRAGVTQHEPVARVRVINADDQTLKLHWSRLVRSAGVGEVELVATRGSGDIASAARSDGFVLIPPGEQGHGPWPFYPWRVGG